MSKRKSISREFRISFPESQFPGRKTFFDQKLMPRSVWFSQEQRIVSAVRVPCPALVLSTKDTRSPCAGDKGLPPSWNHPNVSPAASVGLVWYLVGMLPASSMLPSHHLPSPGARFWSHPRWPLCPQSGPSTRGPVAVLPLPSTAHQTEEVATAELLKAFFWWRPPVLRD